MRNLAISVLFSLIVKKLSHDCGRGTSGPVIILRIGRRLPDRLLLALAFIGAFPMYLSNATSILRVDVLK